jgi:ATP-dependent Zn protease
MSEKLGSVRYAGDRLRYLGGAVNESNDSSAETRQTIDAEVRRIIGEQAACAESLLMAHRDVLTKLATRLLAVESLDGNEVREFLGRPTAGPVSATSPDPPLAVVASE